MQMKAWSKDTFWSPGGNHCHGNVRMVFRLGYGSVINSYSAFVVFDPKTGCIVTDTVWLTVTSYRELQSGRPL